MIHTALDHAASVTMGSDGDTVARNSVHNELDVLRGQTIQTLLDDVIAVEILYHSHNVVLQGASDSLDL